MRKHTLLIVAAVIAGWVTQTTAQSLTVTTKSGRPVAEALDVLQQVYGLPINYEDPPYAYPDDLRDVTEQYRRDPTAPNRIIVPRGHPLSFTYVPPPVRDPIGALRTAIANVIAQDEKAVGFTQFAVVDTSGLSVVPLRVRDARGDIVPVQPVLSTPVTIGASGRTVSEVVSEICDQVSVNSGRRVEASMRGSLFAQRTSEVIATNEPASVVLSRVFAELQVPLVWRNLYDPGLQEYTLNLLTVGQPSTLRP